MAKLMISNLDYGVSTDDVKVRQTYSTIFHLHFLVEECCPPKINPLLVVCGVCEAWLLKCAFP